VVLFILNHIWEYSAFSEKLIFNKIADGNAIDPTFRNRVRYCVKSDVETGNYDLQISNDTHNKTFRYTHKIMWFFSS
jgi:hypothetical protein